MSVLLTGLHIKTAKVQLLDFGGELTPGLGGTVQRINRLGTRHALIVTLPPLTEGTTGRTTAAKIRNAKQNGVLFPFPQYGFAIGSPGTPLVNGAITGGSSISVKGLTAGYVIREGQYFSIIHSARRYLYLATADATANGSGIATVPIFPMLRTPLADGDVVEIAQPYIEGLLMGNIEFDLMLEPFIGMSLTIQEAA